MSTNVNLHFNKDKDIFTFILKNVTDMFEPLLVA